jgi:hypothetical protein
MHESIMDVIVIVYAGDINFINLTNNKCKVDTLNMTWRILKRFIPQWKVILNNVIRIIHFAIIYETHDALLPSLEDEHDYSS